MPKPKEDEIDPFENFNMDGGDGSGDGSGSGDGGDKLKQPDTIKLGDEDVPISEVPSRFAKLHDTVGNQSKEFEKFRIDLTEAISGKKDKDGIDFDEVEFLSNPEYRKKYFDNQVNSLMKEKIEEMDLTQKSNQQQIGSIKYESVKEEVLKEIENSDIEFDFKKHEEQINKIMMGSFNKDYIRKNPKAAYIQTINMVLKQSGKELAAPKSGVDTDIERPSRGISAGKQKTAGDEIRSGILNATQNGGGGSAGSQFG